MSKLNKLGIKGEQIARLFLEKKGHLILFTNFRIAHKEIDIISIDKNELVFTEIKTRSSLMGGYPEDHISKAKIKHLKSALEQFLHQNPQYTYARIDVISIILKNDIVVDIQHYEDAIY